MKKLDQIDREAEADVRSAPVAQRISELRKSLAYWRQRRLDGETLQIRNNAGTVIDETLRELQRLGGREDD